MLRRGDGQGRADYECVWRYLWRYVWILAAATSLTSNSPANAQHGPGDPDKNRQLERDLRATRARLAEIKRARSEDLGRPLSWSNQSWPRDFAVDQAVRNQYALVELQYDTREVKATVTFERVVPETRAGTTNEAERRSKGPSDGRSDEKANNLANASLRVPLTIEGSEWIALPPGKWRVKIDCADRAGRSQRYASEKVKLERGRAYRLEFGEGEEREALNLIGRTRAQKPRPGSSPDDGHRSLSPGSRSEPGGRSPR